MEIQVQEATAEDYEGVLALDPENKIYGGNDYIPSSFHKFLKDPDHSIVVCVTDNKIVALAVFDVVDNGETLVGMAARTHAYLRDKGIWSILKTSPKSPANDTSRSTKYMVAVSDWDWSNVRGRKETIWAEPNILLRRDFKIYEFDSKLIEDQRMVLPGELSTRVLSADESMEYMRNPEVQWQVFPNKRIVCNTGIVVYKLLDDNFRKIIRDMDGISVTVDKQGHCKSMAFGNGIQVHNGYQYSLHYFGACPEDVMDVVQQVRAHLPVAAKNQSKQPLHLRLFFSISMSEPEISLALKTIPAFQRAVTNKIQVHIREYIRDDKTLAKL